MSESNVRILCVEDNRDSREMIAILLRGSNPDYSVKAVETAAEALALTSREVFDLFILDIWLPGMDGVELCRRLREQGVTAPIMFFSAMGVQAKDQDYVLAAGADAFLVKSIDLEKLVATVERLLERHKSG
jgi:two-component system, OmpR family, response regulator RegX3